MSCNLAVNFSLCYLCCGFHSGQVICREPLPCWLKVILYCHQEIRKNNGTRLASPFSLLFRSKILTLYFFFSLYSRHLFYKKKKKKRATQVLKQNEGVGERVQGSLNSSHVKGIFLFFLNFNKCISISRHAPN